TWSPSSANGLTTHTTPAQPPTPTSKSKTATAPPYGSHTASPNGKNGTTNASPCEPNANPEAAKKAVPPPADQHTPPYPSHPHVLSYEPWKFWDPPGFLRGGGLLWTDRPVCVD